MSKLVESDTSFTYNRQFWLGGFFGRKICAFLSTVLNNSWSYRPILRRFNTKHKVAYGYNISKFKTKSDKKLWPWECRMGGVLNGRRDVIKLRYRGSEKGVTCLCPWNYLCEISKNRPSCLGCRADTDRHTDRHPRSILTISVKMISQQAFEALTFWVILVFVGFYFSIGCARGYQQFIGHLLVVVNI